MSVEQRGTFFVFLSALLYSIGGLCIKVIPWSGMAINGGRTGIAVIVIGIYLLITKHPPRMNRWIFLGSMAVCLTNSLFAVANKMTTAANAIVLQFTAPIFVILFSILFFREKPKRLDVGACIVVLAGILFFFVDSLEMGGGIGNGIALLSGITYAGVFMLNKFPDSDAICSVFWGDVISALVGLPFLFRETEFPPVAVGSLLILGVFQVGFAYICMCIGLKTTPPVTACLVSGVEPIMNPILVAVFYHEKVGKYAVVGAGIVLIGVIGYNILKARSAQVPISKVEAEKHSDKGEDYHDLL